jgi:hypothetical protein
MSRQIRSRAVAEQLVLFIDPFILSWSAGADQP